MLLPNSNKQIRNIAFVRWANDYEHLQGPIHNLATEKLRKTKWEKAGIRKRKNTNYMIRKPKFFFWWHRFLKGWHGKDCYETGDSITKKFLSLTALLTRFQNIHGKFFVDFFQITFNLLYQVLTFFADIILFLRLLLAN